MQVIAILTVPDDAHPDDAIHALRNQCWDLEQEIHDCGGKPGRITIGTAPGSVDAVILLRALSISELIVNFLKTLSGG